MNDSKINYLFNRFVQKTSTDKERQELLELVRQPANAILVQQLITQVIENTITDKEISKQKADEMFARILEMSKNASVEIESADEEGAIVRKIFPWKRLAVAASVTFIVGLGVYFLFFNKAGKQIETAKTNATYDVAAPTIARATLKLSDGTIVYLDSAKNGSLAVQGNVNVVKLSNGEISYQTNSADDNVIRYNTISNPRGSKIQPVTLIDGTKVWLNAESSITYPTVFVGNERKVSITGEAYFEIVHNAAKPFTVTVNGIDVHDLGTSFNVNGYDDEANTKITLIDGVVQVQSVTLKPGQQAVVNSSAPLRVANADVEQVLAWKNGLFSFDQADIRGVMRQLARWYDVEVSFEGKPPTQLFGGEIQRTVMLSKVLDNLEKYGVHFRIENKKIIVLP